MAQKETNHSEIDTAIKADRFQIDWPEELQIEPLFKVQISPTRSIWVYEQTQLQAMNGVVDTLSGYQMETIITKTGLPPVKEDIEHAKYGHYDSPKKWVRTLLEVRMTIQAASTAAMPRTKTVTQKVKVVLGGDDED
ncbi:hypothetical protein EVB41_049 [Rhizobium phage RHph_TM3_14A]|nr:hypothetical protein EVB29_049 [Rhizobium phage RHph_TM27A]QIG66969.1 hypothetical protein EVB30_049 [Rhizobium phage RHph_TM27B]QIG67058.1 hypothetical protein EVB31_048 [Rhizobium phage RHph_TM29]QIG67514.1 hypothetical protein EVB41_049 [Rhizobium phage RHph_TM3_14A]